MAAGGETYQERSKGKDVRTSNIVAAKVRIILAFGRNDKHHYFGIGWLCLGRRENVRAEEDPVI